MNCLEKDNGAAAAVIIENALKKDASDDISYDQKSKQGNSDAYLFSMAWANLST